MSELVGEELHTGGLVEVGPHPEDPASLAMGFDGTILRRLWEVPGGAHRLTAGYEIVFENEDDGPLEGELYAIYRMNDPLLKARGEVLFAGWMTVADASGPVTLRSTRPPDVAPDL